MFLLKLVCKAYVEDEVAVSYKALISISLSLISIGILSSFPISFSNFIANFLNFMAPMFCYLISRVSVTYNILVWFTSLVREF